MKLLFLFVCAFHAISAIDVVPEKLETELRSSKYFQNTTFSFRRRGRHSPYYITYDYNSTVAYGNNVTLKWEVYEYLSGHYVLIPLLFEYKLCDFLYKDPYLGQMYAKQLSGNWSCPFPAGRSVFRNLVMHAEKLPIIPFTYSSLIVRARADLLIYFKGPPYEEISFLRFYVKIIQKLKKPKH